MSLETGKVTYSNNISIAVKEAAAKFNLSDKDISKVNSNNDDKITIGELKSAGLGMYPGLAEYFNKQTNGALFAAEGIKPVTQPEAAQKNNFVKNTFNSAASVFRPEQRDLNNAALLGDDVKGRNLYVLA